MKFKVGDKVKLVKKIIWHNCDIKLGEIYEIKIADDDSVMPYCTKNGEWFKEEELELVSNTFTKSDLKDGDIVTYRDGRKRTVKGKNLIDSDGDEANELSLFKENLTDIDNRKEFDIVKVERPVKYETVFEREEEILDEVEKRYLKQVIRPFRNEVRFIEKEDNNTIARIKICFDYHFMFFPALDRDKKMYEGMQSNRAYSLKELGL